MKRLIIIYIILVLNYSSRKKVHQCKEILYAYCEQTVGLQTLFVKFLQTILWYSFLNTVHVYKNGLMIAIKISQIL